MTDDAVSALPLLPHLAATPAQRSPALPSGPAVEALHQAVMEHAVAEAHGHPLLRCEALTETARCLAAGHAYTASESCLVLALAAARQLPASQDLQADLLCALAEVCCNAADLLASAQEGDDEPAPGAPDPARLPRERARAWAEAAAQAAGATSDTHWQIQVLLRAADVLARGGDVDESAALQRQAMALQEPTRPTRWATTAPGLRHAAPRQAM